jgi:lipid-binding SYLF domain-containing protein
MSFFSRAGVEMGHAVLDAYGNLVYGDDAGKSAKLVFLARPRACGVGGGDDNHKDGKKQQQHASTSTQQHQHSSLSLSQSKSAAEDGAAQQQKSQQQQKSESQQPPLYDLGMTFVEINDRAYVKSVTAGSEAAKAGIQPRDAVQFAFVHTDVKIISEFTSHDQDQKALQCALGEERKGKRTSFAELSRMFPFDISVNVATQHEQHYALAHAASLSPDNRQRGDDLHSSDAANDGNQNHNNMNKNKNNNRNPQGDDNDHQGGNNDPSSANMNNHTRQSQIQSQFQAQAQLQSQTSQQFHAFIHSFSSSSGGDLEELEDEEDPSQLSDMKNLVLAEQHQQQTESLFYNKSSKSNGRNTATSSSIGIYPVAMVLRRTRQRQRLVGEGMPHSILPTFRLDDECDRASLLIGKLAPTSDMVPVPDAWDELCGIVTTTMNANANQLDYQEWFGPEGALLGPLGCGEDSPASVPTSPTYMYTSGSATANGGTDTGNGHGNGTRPSQAQTKTKTHDPPPSRRDSHDDIAMNQSRHNTPHYSSIPPDKWELTSAKKLEEVQQRLVEEATLKEMEGSEQRQAACRKIRSCNSANNFPSFMDFDPCACVVPTGAIGSTGSPSGGDGQGGSGSSSDPPPLNLQQIERATLRGMIQNAVGLAFLRVSKVVLGVSLHAGSGIVVARLPDGTWSAPSAIGTYGFGLGLQFGLEVADYLMVLQTQEALESFKQGSHVCVGGNIGAAVAGMGREAFGAASIRNPLVCGDSISSSKSLSDDDQEHPSVLRATEFAPILAYAKTQGLYVGVSLDGLKLFTRHDMNAKEYKLAGTRTNGNNNNGNGNGNGHNQKEISATPRDILSGKVATPPEAEGLYGMLHSVEFAHELSVLPRPPELLRQDNEHDWRYDRPSSIILVNANHANNANRRGGGGGGGSSLSLSSNTSTSPLKPQTTPTVPLFQFFQSLTEDELESCSEFETCFKKFLYGGVSVQRLLPNAELAGGKTRRERRTLWLMLPEVGSLRLGFLSKVNDGSTTTGTGTTTNGSSSSSSNNNHNANHNNAFPDDFTTQHGDGDGETTTLFSEEDQDLFSIDDVTATSFTTAGENTSHASTYMSGMNHSIATKDLWGGHHQQTSPRQNTNHDSSSKSSSYVKHKNNKHNATKQQQSSTTTRHGKHHQVQLSSKHSMALTDVTLLSQEPSVSIRYSPDDATEHLRVISIHAKATGDSTGTSTAPLLFLANNFREAELLVCGLKLLLERETNRLSVRGGQTKAALFGLKTNSPSKKNVNGGGGTSSIQMSQHQHRMPEPDAESVLFTSRVGAGTVSTYDTRPSQTQSQQAMPVSVPHSHAQPLPDGQASWSQVPQRAYLHQRAVGAASSTMAQPTPIPVSTHMPAHMPMQMNLHLHPPIPIPAHTYTFGELLVRDIAVGVELPLPLAVCRALLLDSTSPVITKWEAERGDSRYVKSQWMFPSQGNDNEDDPSDQRTSYQSEHEFIARGSMKGAYRTSTYDRPRNGSVINLMETQMVETDDLLMAAKQEQDQQQRVELVVTERTPRRGFSVRMRIILTSMSSQSTGTLITVQAECRPMGRNMSNQTAVHKAFCLVVNEISMRYGTQEPKGLLAAFAKVLSHSSSSNVGVGEPLSLPKAVAATPKLFPSTTPVAASSNHAHYQQQQQRYEQQHQQQSVPPDERRQQQGTQSRARGERSNGNNGGGGERGNVEQRGALTPPPPQPLTSISTSHIDYKNAQGRASSSPTNNPTSPVTFADVLNTNRPTTRMISAKEEMRDQRQRHKHQQRQNHQHQMQMQNSQQNHNNLQSGGDSGSSEDDLEMQVSDSDSDDDESNADDGDHAEPTTIEVKPLPKIRLSLMPAPREEDELEDDDEEGDAAQGKTSGRRKSSSKKHESSTRRKSSKKGSGSGSSSRRHKTSSSLKQPSTTAAAAAW